MLGPPNETERGSLPILMGAEYAKASYPRADGLRLFIDSLPSINFLVNREGAIRFVSKSIEKNFYYNPEGLVDRKVFDLICGEDLPGFQGAFAEVLRDSQKSETLEARVIRPDGSLRWVESTFINLLEEPSLGAVVVNWRDIQERKRLEEALKQAVIRRENAISEVAHELNTPVTALSLDAQLSANQTRRVLERTEASIDSSLDKISESVELSKQHSDLVSFVRAKTMEMTTLIKLILDQSQFDSGNIELRKTIEDFREVIEDGVKDASMMRESRHQIELSIGEGALIVNCDRTRMKQVLVNLLANAIKYSPDDSKITVNAFVANSALEVSVSDKGRGIPESALEHVFDRYYTDSRGSEEGYGIGLSVVKAIIEAHGGEIGVKSAGSGQGSTFSFWLPL